MNYVTVSGVSTQKAQYYGVYVAANNALSSWGLLTIMGFIFQVLTTQELPRAFYLQRNKRSRCAQFLEHQH